LHQARGRCPDAEFLLAMKFFLFPQCGIGERPSLNRQYATVGPVQQSMAVEDFQIFSNRNFRSPETPRQVFDQCPSVVAYNLENGSAPFLV